MLLLILGCAVQCEQKELFIDNIKTLKIDVQHEIVDYIKDVSTKLCVKDSNDVGLFIFCLNIILILQ